VGCIYWGSLGIMPGMKDRSQLLTEQRNPESMNLDAMSIPEAVALMNAQDRVAVEPVGREQGSIARPIELVVGAFKCCRVPKRAANTLSLAQRPSPALLRTFPATPHLPSNRVCVCPALQARLPSPILRPNIRQAMLLSPRWVKVQFAHHPSLRGFGT
jgi:hypothetical protein